VSFSVTKATNKSRQKTVEYVWSVTWKGKNRKYFSFYEKEREQNKLSL
jgi:hypothetical protein